MKKLLSVMLIIIGLLFANGCSAQREEGPAPSIESQLSEAHREFQEKRNWGQIAFYSCGGIVVVAILFKVGAIITGVISGRRLAKRRQKEKEEKVKRAWQKEMSNFEMERLRYNEYMEEQRKRHGHQHRP